LAVHLLLELRSPTTIQGLVMAIKQQIQTELMQRFGGAVQQPVLPQPASPAADNNVIIWQMGTVWGTVTSEMVFCSAKPAIQ